MTNMAGAAWDMGDPSRVPSEPISAVLVSRSGDGAHHEPDEPKSHPKMFQNGT